MVDRSAPFSFGHLPKPKFNYYGTKDASDLFKKWSMEDGLRAQGFYFDRPLKVYLLNEFIEAFFSSPHVVSHLVKLSPGHSFDPIAIPAEMVKFQEVKCTLTNTQIFSRLTAEGSPVARPSGSIRKCLPTYFQPPSEIHDSTCPIEISDQLRKMTIPWLTKNSVDDVMDNYDDYSDCDWAEMFTETEKDEFLFRLFCHFVLGGTLCQYEDTVEPYVNAAKRLYKDLVTVSTILARDSADGDSTANSNTDRDDNNSDEKKLAVSSIVVKVNCVKNESYSSSDNLLFFRPHINNFLYLIIQPQEQTVYTLYHHVV